MPQQETIERNQPSTIPANTFFGNAGRQNFFAPPTLQLQPANQPAPLPEIGRAHV